MKFFKTIFITFIFLTCSVKADLDQNLIKEFQQGGKLIFIRHAYAPGNGDPNNFNLNDCSTQRNLSKEGRKQAQLIGVFFKENKIQIDKVLSSEWCRCKETAEIAFEDFSTISFLNSFYSTKFAKKTGTFSTGFNGFIAKRFVLKPIFSPTAIASSVVPVLEHSSLNFKNLLSFLKKFEIS